MKGSVGRSSAVPFDRVAEKLLKAKRTLSSGLRYLTGLDRSRVHGQHSVNSEPRHRRLLAPIGHVPPAEAEAGYYLQTEPNAMAA